jgi:hypothetical protein
MRSFRSVIPTPAVGGGIPTEGYEPQDNINEWFAGSFASEFKRALPGDRDSSPRKARFGMTKGDFRALRVQSFWLSSLGA